jgi:hypothetical protein
MRFLPSWLKNLKNPTVSLRVTPPPDPEVRRVAPVHMRGQQTHSQQKQSDWNEI